MICTKRAKQRTRNTDFNRILRKDTGERIKTLESAERIEDLFTINSLNYEVLKGDKAGISSIRVNNQYRIEFTVTDNGAEPIVSVCNILELSNHYK